MGGGCAPLALVGMVEFKRYGAVSRDAGAEYARCAEDEVWKGVEFAWDGCGGSADSHMDYWIDNSV